MASVGVEDPLSSTTNSSRCSVSDTAASEKSTTTNGEAYKARVWGDKWKMHHNCELTDVKLVTQGQSIRCHRVILAAATKFFHDKLISSVPLEKLGWSEGHHILEIKDIDLETLTSVVEFIYSGKIDLTLEKIEKLIPACDILMFSDLSEECKNFLEEMATDASDCVVVYRIAKASCLENTARKAWGVMLDKLPDITTTTSFKELPETELHKYLSDRGLNVASEDPVFDVVVIWVRHCMENRADAFEKLVDYVTLSHCSLGFLTEVVRQEPLMQNVTCLQRLSDSLGAQASDSSLHLGTPRRVPCLVALCKDQCWMLRAGESEWLNKGLVAGEILTSSSACMTGDGILITGGRTGHHTNSKQSYKLSLPTMDWTAVADLNVARREHVSVCAEGQVYVLGGRGDSGKLQSVEYLDDKTGSWGVTTDMPVALYGHTAVSYKHYIYVFWKAGFLFQNSGESFLLDTVSKTWSRRAETPLDCIDVSSVAYRDRIYVMGGNENWCMSYNPDQDQWQTHPTPKEDHAGGSAVVWGDRILQCGGDYTSVIEAYSPETDSWSEWEHSLPQKHCHAVVQLCYNDRHLITPGIKEYW